MAINFNSLPTDKPATNSIIPKGTYVGKIAKAEMRQGKDPAKPPYLNIEFDVSDQESGTPRGKLWAIMTESEAPLQRYQLARLIKALDLPITGDFELKDLTKMIPGKTLLVDIMPEDTKDANKAPERSVIDVFSGEVFYPMVTDDDLPFSTPMVETPAPTVASTY